MLWCHFHVISMLVLFVNVMVNINVIIVNVMLIFSCYFHVIVIVNVYVFILMYVLDYVNACVVVLLPTLIVIC